MSRAGERWLRWGALCVAAVCVLRALGLVRGELVQGSEYVAACVARSYHRYGLTLFTPRIDCYTERVRIYLGELQLYNFLVALLYRVFGVREVLGRAFNWAMLSLQVVLVYRLLSARLTPVAAALAAAVFAAVPVVALVDVTFNRYALSFTLSFASLVLLERARRGRTTALVAASWALIALATVTYVRQIPILAVWVLSALAVARERRWRAWPVAPLAFGALAFLAAAGWMMTQRISSWDPALVHGWEDAGRDYTSLDNYLLWLGEGYLSGFAHACKLAFGGRPGLLLALAGLILAPWWLRIAALVWIAAYAAFYAVVDPTTMLEYAEWHPQGSVPFALPFAALAGAALGWVAERRARFSLISGVALLLLVVQLDRASRDHAGMAELFRATPPSPFKAIGALVDAASRPEAQVLETNTVKYHFVAYTSGRLSKGTVPAGDLVAYLERGELAILRDAGVLALDPLLLLAAHPRALTSLLTAYDFAGDAGSAGVFVKREMARAPSHPRVEVGLVARTASVAWDAAFLPREAETGAVVRVPLVLRALSAGAGPVHATITAGDDLVMDTDLIIAAVGGPDRWPPGVPVRVDAELRFTRPGRHVLTARLEALGGDGQAAALGEVEVRGAPIDRAVAGARWLSGTATLAGARDVLPELRGTYTLVHGASLHLTPDSAERWKIGEGPLFREGPWAARMLGWDPVVFDIAFDLDAPIALAGVRLGLLVEYPGQGASAVEVHARSPLGTELRVGHVDPPDRTGDVEVVVPTVEARTSHVRLRLFTPSAYVLRHRVRALYAR